MLALLSPVSDVISLIKTIEYMNRPEGRRYTVTVLGKILLFSPLCSVLLTAHAIYHVVINRKYILWHESGICPSAPWLLEMAAGVYEPS